ncbi:MAG: AEC family transporter [Vicinamibacterales bacterium]
MFLFSFFADDLVPIFVVASIGFVLARRLHVDVTSISRITFNALAPCLVFNLLVTSRVGAAEFGLIVAYTLLLVAAVGVMARVAAIPLRLDRPHMAAFLIVVMFSNAGNYGLSVVLFAFGGEALARAAIFFVTSALVMYTFGTFLASRGRHGGRAALGGLLRVPAVWGLAAGLLVIWTGADLPKAVSRPIELLGAAAIPSMLLVLGMQFERGGRPDRPGLVALASALVLVGTPVIGFLLAEALGLTGITRQALLVQSAMPSAVITTIVALEFDIAPAFVASVVVVTTLASPVTVSILIALLQSGF